MTSLLEQLKSFSHEQRSEIMKTITNLNRDIRNHHRQSSIIPCPFCRSQQINKNGFDMKKQERYICKQCGHSFGKNTSTITHSIKKVDDFKKFAITMLDSYKPLKQMASQFNISISTAFDWRHKVLAMLQNNTHFEGLLNIDIFKMPLNSKGKPTNASHRIKNKTKALRNKSINMILCADYEPNYSFAIFPTSINKITKNDIPLPIVKTLANFDIVVTAPKRKSLLQLSNQLGLHKKILFDDVDHPDCVFAFDHAKTIKHEFMEFINKKMHGISSSYLSLYSKWSQLLHHTRRTVFGKSILMHNEKKVGVWFDYINIKNNFRIFLNNHIEIMLYFENVKTWKSLKKIQYKNEYSFAIQNFPNQKS